MQKKSHNFESGLEVTVQMCPNWIYLDLLVVGKACMEGLSASTRHESGNQVNNA